MGIVRKGTNIRIAPLISRSREALALVATMRVAGLESARPLHSRITRFKCRSAWSTTEIAAKKRCCFSGNRHRSVF